MNFEISVSPGELIDRLTIIEIKIKKIKSRNKLSALRNEHNNLKAHYKYLRSLYGEKIRKLKQQLYSTNLKLWNIENIIRQYEAKKKFDGRFIKLAREVYRNNDIRSEIKNRINMLTGSVIEIKQYSRY